MFTCSGGEDRYKTSYAVFGFRYAKIETDVPFRTEDFEAIAVYSDLEQTGAFRCSNEKVNKLYENTLWSMKGNFLDIPTDCPTRERLGWTGDAQIFFDTGAYMMNIAPFFRKWMQDMADGMMKNGVVPAVVPYAGLEMMYNNTGASAGWGDAAVILPYRFWKRYGDRQVMETYYEKIARPYAEFMIAHTGHSDKKDAKRNPWNAYVYEKGMHLGEWLEPEEFQDNVAAGKTQKQTEVATAYFHYSMTLLSEMAEALGKKEEGKKFRDYAEGSKKAYEWLYLKDGAPDTDRQAKLVRPLAFGLGDLSRERHWRKDFLKRQSGGVIGSEPDFYLPRSSYMSLQKREMWKQRIGCWKMKKRPDGFLKLTRELQRFGKIGKEWSAGIIIRRDRYAKVI